VELPSQAQVEEVEEDEAAPPATGSDVERTDGSAQVLFIDDEPALCSLVAEYLTRQGHDVTVEQTGEEGLQRALDEHFDVIICDMRLPGISGEDVCMALLEQKPEAVDRMVVATGDILSPQTQDFFDRTGLPHIHKPFKLDQLESEIARIMSGRPAEA
jgi:two-component system NtrC family sensor kinase